MAKVVFWSPEIAMTGDTHAIVAVSAITGIKHKAKCLVINGCLKSKKIETSFTPYYELKESKAFSNSNMGMGAIVRLVTSNRLTADYVKNYAKPVLKERLDILYGMFSEDAEECVTNLTYITRKADEIYDIVFVDLTKGSEEQYIKDVLADADVVVCVVNQDVVKLDEFFEKVENDEILKGKNKIFVVGNYEDKSKYNIYNIKNRFRVKEPIYQIPTNYLFSDACNDGDIVNFIYKNMNADKKDYNGNFINEVTNLSEKILDLAKIRDL